MKMKKVLENQGLFLAEKERFELSRRYNRPTPLAGAPLRPLEYFSVYSSQSAVAWDLRHTILYTFFIFLSSPFLLFLKKDHDYCIQGLQMTKKPRSQHKICRYKQHNGRYFTARCFFIWNFSCSKSASFRFLMLGYRVWHRRCFSSCSGHVCGCCGCVVRGHTRCALYCSSVRYACGFGRFYCGCRRGGTRCVRGRPLHHSTSVGVFLRGSKSKANGDRRVNVIHHTLVKVPHFFL